MHNRQKEVGMVPFIVMFAEVLPKRSAQCEGEGASLELTTMETYSHVPDYDDGPGSG